MNHVQLTRRIEELSELLKRPPSEGIRIDFYSFTEPEQLVILKNAELEEKHRYGWTQEAIIENKELITKCSQIVIERVNELFLFAMPRALMLDEVDQFFFDVNFWGFWERWIECNKNVLLGHRDLRNTLIYINLEKAIFQNADEEYHVKVAENLDEACRLLEVGFEYVTNLNGAKLFRKRK